MAPALSGQTVHVFGLGKSGVAAARLLLAQGARVVVVDDRPTAELGPEAAALEAQGVALRCTAGEGGATKALADAARVVVSPGVPLARTELQALRARGVPLWGEIELAYRLLPPAPLFGITGTNGKSTTTALTGALFAASGRRTFVGGNLGRPLAEAPLEATPYEAYVVELSSFQLEGAETLRVNGAALLNLTPDHLDRYPTHQAYGEAKARIFRNQQVGDFAVINGDDAEVLELSRQATVPVHAFTAAPASRRAFPPGVVSVTKKTAEGFRLGEHDFLLRNRALRGAHNLQNAMAAALLAFHGGVPAEAIQRGLDGYPGLPHRLESVRTLDGVEWVNDSKATNVDSTLVALRAFPRGLWLIAGGKGKGAPYAPMVAESQGRVKGVLTIGQDAPAIGVAYGTLVPVHACGTLEQAVARARELSTAGDTVLLSPACASYDQFKNFEDRGERFKRLVGSL